MATRDPVGTALASIGAGATTGAVVLTGGVLVLRSLQAGAGATVAASLGFAVLIAAVLLGMATAVTAGWVRSRPIDDVYRRGVVAALSVFGAALLALVAAPLDMAAGRPGLAGYLGALVLAAIVAHRAARRAGDA